MHEWGNGALHNLCITFPWGIKLGNYPFFSLFLTKLLINLKKNETLSTYIKTLFLLIYIWNFLSSTRNMRRPDRNHSIGCCLFFLFHMHNMYIKLMCVFFSLSFCRFNSSIGVSCAVFEACCCAECTVCYSTYMIFFTRR